MCGSTQDHIQGHRRSPLRCLDWGAWSIDVYGRFPLGVVFTLWDMLFAGTDLMTKLLMNWLLVTFPFTQLYYIVVVYLITIVFVVLYFGECNIYWHVTLKDCETNLVTVYGRFVYFVVHILLLATLMHLYIISNDNKINFYHSSILNLWQVAGHLRSPQDTCDHRRWSATDIAHHRRLSQDVHCGLYRVTAGHRRSP